MVEVKPDVSVRPLREGDLSDAEWAYIRTPYPYRLSVSFSRRLGE